MEELTPRMSLKKAADIAGDLLIDHSIILPCM